MTKDLTRFTKAQESDFETALSEIKAGRKRSHWMWYIFPQMEGLGFSETSRYYGIQNLQEAKDYLKDAVLGKRLETITKALLNLDQTDPRVIFGSPDYLKLQSSMTLFSVAAGEKNSVYSEVLERCYGGARDLQTLALLKEDKR